MQPLIRRNRLPTGLGMGANGYQRGLGPSGGAAPGPPLSQWNPKPWKPRTQPQTNPTPRVPTVTPRAPVARVPTGLGMGANGYQDGLGPGGPAPRVPAVAPHPPARVPPGHGMGPDRYQDGLGPGSETPPAPTLPPDPAPTLPPDQGSGLASPSVSERVRALVSSESPLMRLAKTQGLQAANQRGLLNSSMAIQASQDAMLRQAVPIASQEANLDFNERLNLSRQQFERERQNVRIAAEQRIAAMNLRGSFQQSAMSLAESIEGRYMQAINAVNQNTNLPAEQRQQMLDLAARLRDSSYRLMQQIYGIELRWSTPSTRPTRPVGRVPPGRDPATVGGRPQPPVGLGIPGLGGFSGLGILGRNPVRVGP